MPIKEHIYELECGCPKNSFLSRKSEEEKIDGFGKCIGCGEERTKVNTEIKDVE